MSSPEEVKLVKEVKEDENILKNVKQEFGGTWQSGQGKYISLFANFDDLNDGVLKTFEDVEKKTLNSFFNFEEDS